MAFNFAHLLSAACGGAARRLRALRARFFSLFLSFSQCNFTEKMPFLPSARDGGLFERPSPLAPGGPTVAGDPRESTPGRVPWSRAWIPAREALERHTGDSLLDALVQASTGHNAARRPPRPGWSASELRPGPSCMSASAVAAAGPPDGRQSLPSVCCRGRARDSCRGAECSGEPEATWVTKW